MFLIAEIEGNESYSVRLGICSGLATLLRFNCAILVVIGAAICLWSKRSLKEASVLCFVAALIVSPWIVRNAVVFQGKILFSSHGGINLLEGVLTPDGRAQSGETERIRAEVGWLHSDIEVNDPHRNLFSSEPQLDRQADLAAIAAWRNLGWKSAVTLSLKKTLRLWCYLYSSSRTVALTLGFYVLFFTLAHLPFVMNTRLRIPFADPLIAILAGGGFVASVERIRQSCTREPDLKPNRERDHTSQMQVQVVTVADEIICVYKVRRMPNDHSG
jgi:4-amino-4-deoxy-L-arabinose transferase-like glycosyltransferase